jgi:hypothetical protein
VKASKLQRGDVAFIHSRWDLVIDTRRGEKDSNNGRDLEIDVFYGTSYLPSDHAVKIVKRDLFDVKGLQAFIVAHVEEQHRLQELYEKEEKEEREQEREYLERRLRELG